MRRPSLRANSFSLEARVCAILSIMRDCISLRMERRLPSFKSHCFGSGDRPKPVAQTKHMIVLVTESRSLCLRRIFLRGNADHMRFPVAVASSNCGLFCSCNFWAGFRLQPFRRVTAVAVSNRRTDGTRGAVRRSSFEDRSQDLYECRD